MKQIPANAARDEMLKEGIECYKIFIRGLFDITDNYTVDGLAVPESVVCYDKPDPYLVVAADKGTATFSDIANSVSREYGFWLDDAFASGGSKGYDHKAMGITARGAWESVKRHFRTMGKDIQNEDFTVIGVGDMSGDVFGNGMLLSKHICLTAAFNHRHIFIDPQPDAAKSWKERKRLFELAGSSWTDYNEKLISKGGGIFDRSAKSLKVTKEMKKLFALKKDEMTPAELIHHILKSETDLLWFGGIGTYIKSEEELHEKVGDRANDQIRVNGSELRCKAIGEGANLGVTQLARIEFALKGGFINTDAIDNAAGVDCSDHEVNIKILLDKIVKDGDLTDKQRNQLLEDMTENVAELVLDNNYMQTQILSQSLHDPDEYDRLHGLLKALEADKILNRSIEFLPSDNALAERKDLAQKFTAPEISVLLAYAKNTIFKEIMQTDLANDPLISPMLIDYFPSIMQKKYQSLFSEHRLAKEIITTVFTNHMINRAGPTFAKELGNRHGATIDDIGRAYAIVMEVYKLENIYRDIRALDNKVAYATQIKMLLTLSKIINKSAPWILSNIARPIDTIKVAKEYAQGIQEVGDNIDQLLPETFKDQHVQPLYDALTKDGVPVALARKLSVIDFMTSGFDIVNIAKESNASIPVVGKLYYEIGKSFSFRWLRTMAGEIDITVDWEKRAVRSLVDDLYSQQSMVTRKIISTYPDATIDEITEIVKKWRTERKAIFQQFEDLIRELHRYKTIDLAMLTVANRSLRNIIIIS